VAKKIRYQSFFIVKSMRNAPAKSKLVVMALLVRLSVVFALVSSMISFTITPASASMSGDGYYNCNTGVWQSPVIEDFDITRDQALTPEGTYLVWDGSLWLGFSCGGDVVVSPEASSIQASAFNGNQIITSIRIPANTRVNQVPDDTFADRRAFAGTTDPFTVYYCGEWSLANTGIEGKIWVTCPSAPTIKVTFNAGLTYIEFRPSSSDGGSPTMTYTVTAYPVGGVAFDATVGRSFNLNDGAEYTQYEILGLQSETKYTFSISANNGHFDSNDSERSIEVTTAPEVGWYLCATGEVTPDQDAHPLSYRINNEATVVENNGCSGAVVIRPGVFAIVQGFKDSLITSVTIPESVRYLYNAFQDSIQLSQVTFLGVSRLTDIDLSSFEGTNLSSIIIPSSVEYIGEYAFRDATQLVNVNFAENSQLDFIDYGAFKDTSLSAITIPQMVSGIDRNAFMDTASLTTIEVAAANETFRSVDGVLFRVDEDALYELYKYPQAKL
jgi:hypothetical protein